MKNDYKALIKEKGYKITNQREWVLRVLEENTSNHMTAEEIYNEVKVKNPEIGLATVYRTIQLLLDLKIIEALNLNDGVIRYELGIAEKEHHHHLICEICSKVIEIEGQDEALNALKKKFADNYDFEVTSHIVKFYGLCGECKQKMKNSKE